MEYPLKGFRTSNDIKKDNTEQILIYPLLSYKSTQEKINISDHLIHKCKELLKNTDRSKSRYLELILKNLEGGRLTFY